MKNIKKEQIHTIRRFDRRDFLNKNEEINQIMFRVLSSHESNDDGFDIEQSKEYIADLNLDILTKDYLKVRLYVLMDKVDNVPLCFGLFSKDRTRGDWHLEFISTNKDYCGMGYAEALFLHAAKDIANSKNPYISSVVNEDNYADYAIKQNISGRGQRNDTWSGFLFISIKGGQQDTIETHGGQELTLFNPACEYASSDTCLDIDLVMSYYALISINGQFDDDDKKREYESLITNLETALASIEYDNPSYTGNLLDYVKNHYSVSLVPGQLTDPIQLKPITIDKFNISSRVEDSIDFTHEEAVIYEKYYWDETKKCVLSPARPTNVFWSYHLSNMMQQNYGLEDYFKYEEMRHLKRQELINSKSTS